MAETAENRPVAIQVSGVKKMYKLGQIGGGTLQADLQSWWARKRGKEDPNSKIGEGERSHGDTFMALNGIDLTIYQGEAVGIIGSNGAGKSTLLKLLSRVTAPTEGEIDIYGRIASMLEVGTGFNGELTGRENVYMNGAILGMTKQEIDAKMEEIIEFSEVREFIDTPVKRYSSGMFVKLAFSVAAHLDAEIMIMDEVLAVGDMAFQTKCLDKMREAANKDGRTVLYVSHNMNTIRKLCDRCIVLDKGKVVFNGDVDRAIEVYLGNNTEAKTFADISNSAREPIGDSLMHMNSIQLVGLTEPVLYDSNIIKIKVSFSSKIKCQSTAFRVIVFSSAHMPVGMIASNPQLNTISGENQAVYELEFPNLAEGLYSLRIVLYEVNMYGEEIIHDVVDSAISFNKIVTKHFNDTSKRWNSQVWGGIVFPTMKEVD